MVTPSEFPDDPAYSHMGSRWYETTTVYGPGFTLLSEGHAAVVGESDEAAAWLYKVLAAASVLALVVLAARLGRRPAFSAAFVGWNPVLAVHFSGGGHNDALMMALFVGGLALAASGRRQLAGAAWAALDRGQVGAAASSSRSGSSPTGRPADAFPMRGSPSQPERWPA